MGVSVRRDVSMAGPRQKDQLERLADNRESGGFTVQLEKVGQPLRLSMVQFWLAGIGGTARPTILPGGILDGFKPPV